MTYEERADQISNLLEEQLGIRGKTLEIKLRKAGRLLPKSIHRQASVLLDAVKLQGSPKLARMVDEGSVTSAYKICEKYLSEIDPWDRRKSRLISFFSTNAANLLVVSAVVVGVLVWRGFL